MDCTSLGGVVRESGWLSRRVLFATTAPYLAGKMLGTYAVEPAEVFFLPNILNLAPAGAGKHPRPRVVFLGRLDPVKRPWVFTELARRLPHVEFLFLGRSHFEGAGGWSPADLPDNVRPCAGRRCVRLPFGHAD